MKKNIIFSMFLFAIISLGSIQVASATMIHSCMVNLTGVIRIVSSPSSCIITETALSWVKDGIALGDTGSFGGFTTKNFSNGNLAGERLLYKHLVNANFTGTVLTTTAFMFSNLDGANFTNADLSYADLANVSVNNANFSGANLSNANFYSADLEDATGLNTANLTDTNWDNTICPDGTNSDNNSDTCVGHL